MRAISLDLQDLPADPPVPLMGTRLWLEGVSRFSGRLPLRFVGVEDEGKLCAWHPYLEITRGPWKRAISMHVDTASGPFWLYPEGMVFSERAHWQRQVRNELLNELSKRVTMASLYPLECDPRFLPHGWSTKIRATARLDLHHKPFPWPHQSVKKLHKAVNRGLHCVRTFSEQDVLYAYKTTVKRQGFLNAALAPADFIQRLLFYFEKGLLECCSIQDQNGKYVSFGFVIPDQVTETARLWFNLNTPEGLKLYASDYLFHSLAETFQDRFRWLDFCGTDLPNLVEFKEKWASETAYSFQLEYSRSEAHKVALALFSRVRRKLATLGR
ncbi:MAG TPA: hypothetical protein VLM37_12595 [Fibrobacteraceae bacterium]|nr:hypothetical protein [Fibrobacteraceae bacterium]